MPTSPDTANAVDLDLYFDESGRFDEPSAAEASAAIGTGSDERDPSQIVGLLVPHGALSEDKAKQILGTAHRLAGLSMGEVVHGVEIAPKAKYDALIAALTQQIVAQGWQPVRLVNPTGVGFGGHATTYTRMVAELVLRIFSAESRRGRRRIGLRLIPARVKTGESEGAPETIAPSEYEARILEALALSAVRRGVPLEDQGWRIQDIRLLSGTYRRELQICDLLSNASFRNFKRCSPQTTRQLRDLLGGYDFTYSFLAVGEEALRLLELDAVGLAVRVLGEFFLQSSTTDQARGEARDRLDQALARLADMDAPARNAYLAEIVAWLAQLIEGQRVLDTSSRLLQWLQAAVVEDLRSRLAESRKPTLDWFELTLSYWGLTVHNHRGDLGAGQKESARIDKLLPRVAGRWEHANLMLDALVAQAVHLTDSFDYDAVRRRLRAVASNYGDLAELLGSALPDLFPERIRSDLQGRVLGTWLQAEIYAGIADSAHLEIARDLSERALREFTDRADIRRQEQYRSQLECIAGDLPEARLWLARSLELEEHSHDALGRCIATLKGSEQGFALLHWTRIGRLGVGKSSVGDQEGAALIAAARKHGVLSSDWAIAPDLDYPAHGIRRNLAATLTVGGKNGTSEARSWLGHLRRLGALRQGPFVLTLIELAAMAEVACLSWEQDGQGARRLLDRNDDLAPGLVQSIAHVEKRFSALGDLLQRTIASWRAVVARVLANEPDARTELLGLAGRIGY